MARGPRTEKVTRLSDGETFTVTPEVRDALLAHPDKWEKATTASTRQKATPAPEPEPTTPTPAPEPKKES